MSRVIPLSQHNYHPRPGDVVGNGRWPNPLNGNSPPWRGVVLSINDPLAWARSIALGEAPGAEQVNQHVAWCQEQGLLQNTVPILWDFGHRTKVYWESIDGHGHPANAVKPYDHDCRLWRNSLTEETLKQNPRNGFGFALKHPLSYARI